MKKISQVLIESQKTRKQTTGRLVRNFDHEGKPQDYCALGALACEQGLINSAHDMGTLDYSTILKSYGIKYNLLNFFKMPRKSIKYADCEGDLYPLITLIYKLNDRYEWSFKQIGKYIKKLEDEGLIKYE